VKSGEVKPGWRNNSSTSLHEDGQAAVMLHEIICREAIARGATSSIDTRGLTAMLFSRRISDLSQQQARDLLASLGFPFREDCNF
jgi:hypothetical protein